MKSLLDAVRVSHGNLETFLAENRGYEGSVMPDLLRKLDCSVERALKDLTLEDLVGGEEPEPPAPPSYCQD